MVFDMLETPDGRDITSLPLLQRFSLMAAKVAFDGRNGRFRMVERIPIDSDSDVQALVNKCRELEGEGVMLKNLDAPYVARRGRNWVKAKTWQEREFDVLQHGPTGI